MVMQTVRSRSNASVLPYIVSDIKKVEMPPLCTPPKSRQLMDRRLSAELSLSSSDLGNRRRLPSLPLVKEPSKTQRFNGASRFPLLVTLTIVVITFYLGSTLSNEMMKHKITELEKMRDRLMSTQNSLSAQLQRAKRRQAEEMKLRESGDGSRVSQLSADVERLQKMVDSEKEQAWLARRELDLQDQRLHQLKADGERQLSSLKHSVQKMARRQAIEEFGAGPHYAQFTLKLPIHGVKTFTVEFAHLQHMPVTVNNFLQQIKRGLWNDSAFYLKANHVMIARPVSWDTKRSKREAFGELAHVPFPEYNEHFPHTEYTLGLNGNPSGPDFYINRMDNTIPHGPAGHQRDGSAEPCFAKVILGKDTVDLMGSLPSMEGDEFLLKQAVEIVSINIIKDLRMVPGGHDYLATHQQEQIL